MIFIATAIALVLTALLAWRVTQIGRIGTGHGLADRLAKAAVLPAATVAVVGLVYSALSLPFVGVNLNELVLEELRVLESRVPDWAVAFASWVPSGT